jgi:hypothetical protein
MILASKFTEMAPDSMNFVNFAGKNLCFQTPVDGVGRSVLRETRDRPESGPAIGLVRRLQIAFDIV